MSFWGNAKKAVVAGVVVASSFLFGGKPSNAPQIADTPHPADTTPSVSRRVEPQQSPLMESPEIEGMFAFDKAQLTPHEDKQLTNHEVAGRNFVSAMIKYARSQIGGYKSLPQVVAEAFDSAQKEVMQITWEKPSANSLQTADYGNEIADTRGNTLMAQRNALQAGDIIFTRNSNGDTDVVMVTGISERGVVKIAITSPDGIPGEYTLTRQLSNQLGEITGTRRVSDRVAQVSEAVERKLAEDALEAKRAAMFESMFQDRCGEKIAEMADMMFRLAHDKNSPDSYKRVYNAYHASETTTDCVGTVQQILEQAFGLNELVIYDEKGYIMPGMMKSNRAGHSPLFDIVCEQPNNVATILKGGSFGGNSPYCDATLKPGDILLTTGSGIWPGQLYGHALIFQGHTKEGKLRFIHAIPGETVAVQERIIDPANHREVIGLLGTSNAAIVRMNCREVLKFAAEKKMLKDGLPEWIKELRMEIVMGTMNDGTSVTVPIEHASGPTLMAAATAPARAR